MSSNYRLYRMAADDVRLGWRRWDFKDNRGNKCLVQGVLNAANLAGTNLPPQMADELDAHLRKYRHYRAIRFVTRCIGASPQTAIISWNDSIWRRKDHVVEALDSLADTLELSWLREERNRLTAEVARLQAQVAMLTGHVRQLEGENGMLRRLTNSFALRSDRRQLHQLEAELDETWKQLNSLPAGAATQASQ